jgi:hypothetical protein
MIESILTIADANDQLGQVNPHVNGNAHQCDVRIENQLESGVGHSSSSTWQSHIILTQ